MTMNTFMTMTLIIMTRRRMLIPSTTLSIPAARLSEPGNSLLPAQSPGGPPKPPRLSTNNTFRKLGDGGTASDGEQPGAGSGSRKPRRRESHSRRHTLQSGIDYGLLKRMKAIEEERDVLMRGIQTVQRAEEWYNEQLGQVQENTKIQKNTRKNDKIQKINSNGEENGRNNLARFRRGCAALVSMEEATKDLSLWDLLRRTGSVFSSRMQGLITR